MNYSKKHAFSLIELMIVVFIISILTTIAYPTYTEHLYKSRRINAKSALLDYQARIERCYSNSFNYQFCANKIIPSPIKIPPNTNSTYYDVYVFSKNSSTYLLTATANGIQTSDTECNTFSIDNLGVQSAKNIQHNDRSSLCWQ